MLFHYRWHDVASAISSSSDCDDDENATWKNADAPPASAAVGTRASRGQHVLTEAHVRRSD